MVEASSLGAACDLSCAFVSLTSDCHSQRAGKEVSAPAVMKMDGMAMAGMAMPEMGGSQNQQTIPAISQTNAPHSSIVDLGPCEKQACNDGSIGFAKTNGSGDSHFHLILAITETPRVNSAQTLFRGARDDIASFRPRNRNSFPLNLRV